MTEWVFNIGDFSPRWLDEAMSDGRIVPVNDKGPNRWAEEGIRVVATGKVFREGDTITEADVMEGNDAP